MNPKTIYQGSFWDVQTNPYIFCSEKFICCTHGTLIGDCPNCQRTMFLLVLKYTKLPVLPKDIKKLILSYLPEKREFIFCSSCTFHHGQISECGEVMSVLDSLVCLGNMFRLDESGFLFLTGGYDSDFDNERGYFKCPNGYSMNFEMFKEQYLTSNSKITADKLDELNICGICVRIMILNR